MARKRIKKKLEQQGRCPACRRIQTTEILGIRYCVRCRKPRPTSFDQFAGDTLRAVAVGCGINFDMLVGNYGKRG